MDKQNVLEKVAMAFGVSIVVASIWFWWMQVGDMMAILEMAYG